MMKVRDTSPLHLTAEGINRLQERLAGLKRVLPKYIAETQRTAAFGDRSDSAEYKEAKSTLRRTHRQILAIEDQLRRAVVIMTGRNKAGTVQLGSTVVLELPGGEQKKFEIVGPHETDPTGGRISHQSPLGAALLNHAEGDLVTIKTSGGLRDYRILEIR